MSLSSAINSARSGLLITSQRADIVATNVANAGTPGYVRRSVILSETVRGNQTTGVQSNGIARSTNTGLTMERSRVSSDLAQANVLSFTWQTISSRLGDSINGSGLFQTFSALETTIANAALSPESGTQAAAFLDAARGVATEFNSLSNMAATLRIETDREITDGVNTVNAALKKIEDLNAQITGIDRTTGQAAALFDERQRVLDTISEYVPIQTIERDHGKIDVLTTEGVFLVAGSARQIEFTQTAAFGPGDTLSSGVLSGMTVDGIDITPGTATYGAVSSGMLGALFQLRDQDIPGFGDQLDTVAADLINRLSDSTIDPTLAIGDQGLFVDTEPAGGAGLAGRLQINAAVDPAQGGEIWRLRDGINAVTQGPAGNGSILQGLSEALTSVRGINTGGIQGSFSSAEMVAHFSSVTGQARLSHESVLSATATQHIQLAEAEQTENGVDIDSQMQDLLLIEQAYAANARVIEVANQMLNRLMEI